MMSEYGFTKTNIISLLNEGSITVADLDLFSDELKETIYVFADTYLEEPDFSGSSFDIPCLLF